MTPDAARPVDRFAAAVRALCALVESPPATPTSDARDLEVRLLALHLAALDLPDVEPDTDKSEPPLDRTLINKARLAALRVELYWDVFDPFKTPPDAPVANSAADDLQDIYSDVKCGLLLFDAGVGGARGLAVALHLRVHWGEHLVGLVRALHLAGRDGAGSV
jgi:Domain of unknown function (DUF5063)